MDFVVQADNEDLLRQKFSHIRELFNVDIELPPKNGDQQWVYLSCTDRTTKQLETAKDYIKSICSPELRETVLGLSHKAFNLCDIERNFGVVVTLSDKAHGVIFQGSEFNVTRAKSWIEAEADTSLLSDDSKSIATDGSLNPSLKEFALKLGYSEEDVDMVAKKFGPHVDQNKLLRELIGCKSSSVQKTSDNKRENPTRSRQYVARRDLQPRGPVQYEKAEINPYLPTDEPGQNHDVVARGFSTSSHRMDPGGCGTAAQGFSIRTQGHTPNPRAGDVVARGFSVRTYGNDSRQESTTSHDCLRPVVIDGSNVAMNHGNQRVFSCRGIALCIEWFKERGHQEIYAFVPQWRTQKPRVDHPIDDQHILRELARQNLVKFTPSRRIGNRNIVCYDDRFIVDLAYKLNGIIVSNDMYSDLLKEKPEWKDVIENRLLMYSFVGDIFMPPHDPLGKHGPILQDFLQKGTTVHQKICPFIGRCTYGTKCRYYHPERDPQRRQQLLSGKPHQEKVSNPSVSRNRSLSEVTPQRRHELLGQYGLTPPTQHTWPAGSSNSSSVHTTSREFSYTPCYASSYSNAFPSCGDSCGQDETCDSAFAKLAEIFGEGHDERINRVIRENPDLCRGPQNGIPELLTLLIDEK